MGLSVVYRSMSWVDGHRAQGRNVLPTLADDALFVLGRGHERGQVACESHTFIKDQGNTIIRMPQRANDFTTNTCTC